MTPHSASLTSHCITSHYIAGDHVGDEHEDGLGGASAHVLLVPVRGVSPHHDVLLALDAGVACIPGEWCVVGGGGWMDNWND